MDQVRKLKIDYDIRLFDRNRKQIDLTPHGERLLEFTHQLLEVKGREAVQDAALHGGGVGIVSEAEFSSNAGLVRILIRELDLIMNEAPATLKERRTSRSLVT